MIRSGRLLVAPVLRFVSSKTPHRRSPKRRNRLHRWSAVGRIEVCEDRTLLSATTITAVSASARIEPYGQTETLTATISSQAGVPNAGTVTFFDSTTSLGTAPVNDGIATLPTITLSVGVHVIAATYSGDGANFAGSSTALSPSSLIQTFAGTGVSGYNGDGTLPTSAEVSLVGGVAVDSHGNLFFADAGNSRVREVNAITHLITTVAGTGTGGYNGDGIPATSAELADPVSIAVDAAGDLFIADLYNNRVREVNAATGLISTVAGMSTPGYNGDGIPATSAELAGPTGVAVNAAGNVFIVDSDNNRIREVNVATGIISTVAGTGTAGYNGDGIAATSAELYYPSGVAVDANGNLFITDTYNQRIRELNASTGLISTVAGTGTAGDSGDGTPATSAELSYPTAIAVDSAGDLFFSDAGNWVREVNSSTGLISTIAGTGTFGYNGDGIAATSAWLFDPQGVAVDAAGDVFIGDTSNARVREVASGEITVEVTSPSLLTPTVTAFDAGGAYDGNPFTATATAVGEDGVTPVSGSFGFTYFVGSSVSGTGSFAAPTDAGTYTVVADFESADPDYADAESAPVTFTVNPATPTVVASDAGGTFNGKPFPATATVTGPDNTPVVIPRTINYATFLGGSGDDAAVDTTTDRAGNTFVVGYTTSPDFPATPGAYETTLGTGGTQAGFVAKFGPTGNLLWATYIDGAVPVSVVVDSSDNVYVGGFANPGSFEATPGAFQTSVSAASQGSGFVAKLNSSGTSLMWGTYLGASGYTQVDSLAVDGSGDVYVAGDTYASDFPTLNAIQPTNPAPGFDVAFVSELNNTGSGLIFSTYLGGSGDSWPSAIALDGADNIYIDGNVDAPGLPTTPGAFQSTYPGGGQDAFVAKLAAGGTSLAYLTYLGGSVYDTASNFEMAVDSAGDVYVTGTTSSPDFPTVNAYQSTLSGSEDAYVTELNPTGTALVDSTYFGGFSIATGSGIALDSAGNVYLAGTTQPTALTTLVNPVQTNGDYYLAEFDLSTATLLESTYFGTTQDNGNTAAVSVDASGNVIVTGQTDSSSLPTVNAFQPNYGGGNEDGFVMSISPGSPTFTYYAGTTASGTPLPGAPSAVGTYTVVATYTSTDPDYTDAQSDPVTFTISPSTPYPATPTVTAIEGSGTYTGQPFAATGLATGIGGEGVSGSFTFTYYDGSTVSGTGSTVAPTNVGTYTVVAAFTSSDPDYTDAESQPATFTISAATTSTTVSASAATEIYGQTETLTATVVSAAGAIPNAGSVTFTDGAITLGTEPVNNGIATLPTTAIPAGLNILTATYNGDGENFIGSSSVLSPSSVIETVAGNGTQGYTGDGGPGNQAELYNPSGIAVDAAGDLFIADNENYVVREVHAGTGLITTVAGTGTQGYNGDGIPATSAELYSPSAVAVDAQGDLFIADGERVREVSAATGLITTVAGTGQAGYNGDGILATSAELFNPSSLAVDAAGDLFIADYINQRVREVNASTGLISTVAGTGTAGYNGDGIPATSAELNYAFGIALDAAGDLFIADSQNNLVREVSASTGLISTVAGTGTPGYNGDGIAATTAELSFPMGLAVDGMGNLFIADSNNQRIREVTGGVMSTVAGTGAPGYNGDGIPAGLANLGYNVSGVAVDPAGDLFINDQGNDRVREVPSGATVVTVTATAVTPTVAAVDAGGTYDGNPFPASATATGAGGSSVNGTFAFTYYVGTIASGTGSSTAPINAGTYTVVADFTSTDPAYTNAQSQPVTFTISPAATVATLIASASSETYGQPETLTATVTSLPGIPDDGTVTFLDGATTLGTAAVNNGVAMLTTTLPVGLNVLTAAYDGDGGNFASSSSTFGPSSIIQTVAGTGAAGYSGDGGPAASAGLAAPDAVVVDAAGDLFIADTLNNVVREVNATTHLITTVAGTGAAGYNGDGIAATSAELSSPTDIAVDAAGDLFIADYGNNRVREVNAATGLISTVAGTGSAGYNGDGIAATSAELFWPTSVAVDAAGNLFITDYGNNRVREVNAATGLISTVAGTGSAGYNGDGIAATSAELNEPDDVALDAAGDLFIAEFGNNRVREVNAATGMISTVAGTSDSGYNGDGIAATSADLSEPEGVAVDAAGDLFIADYGNNRIRVVSAATGLISTLTGTTTKGYNGDGIPAASAELSGAEDLDVDAAGDVFIADTGNNRIREVSVPSAVVTVTPAVPAVMAVDAGGFYDGNPFPASATATGVDGVTPVSGSFAFTYYVGSMVSGNGSSTAPTDAGTYTVVAAFSSADANYTNAQSAPVTFTIGQATPSVVASDAGGTYDGNPFAATATATGVDGVTPVSGSFAFTYYVGSTVSGNGSSTAPTNSGTYTVVAAFSSADGNYTNSQSTPVTFTIGQATPTVVASDAGGTYNGNPFPASATATGVGGASVSGSFTFTYYVGSTVNGNGSSTAPTNAGTYTVVAAFSSADANYFNSQSPPVTFTIGQATPSVVASDAGGTFNGNPFPASATATGVAGASVSGSFTFTYYVGSTVSGNGSSNAPTNAGTYTVVAAFASSDSNYSNAQSAPVTFTIGQATPSVVASDAGGTYNGNPFPASATATGVGGASVSGSFTFTYYVGSTVNGNGSSTPPTNAGTYTVVAAFSSADTNYFNSQSAPSPSRSVRRRQTSSRATPAAPTPGIRSRRLRQRPASVARP